MDYETKIKLRQQQVENKYHRGDPVLRDLFAVMTVSEAAARFGKHVNTIRAIIMMGKVDVRQSGDTWLITTESLIKYYGPPLPPDLSTVDLALPLWQT